MHSLKGLPHVVDIRTIGLIAGIELASRDGRSAARAYDVFVDCFQRGLLIRVTGDIIAFSPPLIVGEIQIGEIVSDAWRSLEAGGLIIRAQEWPGYGCSAISAFEMSYWRLKCEWSR